MRSRSLFAISLMLLATPAFAATSLCVEDVRTGLRWSNGKWNPTQFQTKQFTLRKASEGDEIAGGCFYGIEASGKSLEAEVAYGTVYSAPTCYVISELGSEAIGADLCTEYTQDGQIVSVVCKGMFDDYGFSPSGEFYAETSGSIGAGANKPIAPDAKRLDAYLSAGRCSVVVP